mgnify:FL=1
MKERKALLIFDFDHSLIDCNSDPWVVNHLGAEEMMLSLRSVISSWTDLMVTLSLSLSFYSDKKHFTTQ